MIKKKSVQKFTWPPKWDSDPPGFFAIVDCQESEPAQRVISETQRAASSSFIHLYNAAKDSGLHRGGAALLTGPTALLRPSGLFVKRPLEKNCGWNTLACLCPVCWTGWIALTLALCQPDPVKPLNKSHLSVVLYMPNGWHSSSQVVL